ncbi:TPA: hypothetical protein U0595_001012 [Streptococcus suis]|uniref:DUF6572 domain-containing protein n=1 Tax=Streptococcus suis TaxID=1307 RepID=UPI00209C4389|nr:DUF6572 domain-containing protein [Streptococcus suis]MCO8179592.1 hypothetical protein [Streptococcus suis]HEM2743242.1 hypothetical protein [Streptococcus suis]HEM2759370.1 hypothetical protein [Streptococcus suis]HEM2765396.1 hypothetical protein [Streptococcus suis]HEM3466722.1 hypothetical protein [Streptococcus suis]
MTKQELLNFVEAHQSEIGAFNIMPGRKFGGQFTLGYYFDEESQKYKVYEVSERQEFWVWDEYDDENKAIDRLYRKILFDFNIENDMIAIHSETIDSIGVVDGHLELLLADGNEWLPDTEQDHLLKLQEKLNNYIHFIESKQYVDSYGDDFTEKVINLTFQYAPSDNGLAFLVQVQKVLQPTDIRLKVVVPE